MCSVRQRAQQFLVIDDYSKVKLNANDSLTNKGKIIDYVPKPFFCCLNLLIPLMVLAYFQFASKCKTIPALLLIVLLLFM